MRNKILFLILITFLLISCGKKEKEPEKEPAPVKAEKVAGGVPQEEKEKNLSEEVKENTNPLSEYISDEIYEDGIRKFYGEDGGMFIEDSNQFAGSNEELKKYIESNFKITMLATQGGKSSAVLYYPSKDGLKRIIVTGGTIVEVEEKIFYIKAFKDRVEIKQGKKGRAVPLYLRERWI